MKKIPVALQLYSVRDVLYSDFEGIIKKVKSFGYEGVELPGLRAEDDPAEIKKILDFYGLAVPSSHVPMATMTADPEKVFEDYKRVGCDYIVIPWLDKNKDLSEEAFDGTVEKIREVGKKAKAAGLTLLYHNHNFEFKKIKGEYILDRLYRMVEAEYLQTQLDTCWVKVGGEDPAAYLRKYANRAPLVHLKDFVGGGEEGLFALIGSDVKAEAKKEKFDFRPIGMGVQDFESIIQAAEQAGSKWLIVEQDSSSDLPTMEAARLSRAYLKGLGY